jgi:magnesium transporter
MSTWKAAALAIAELGIGVFFVSGVARSVVGDAAPWFVLGACALAALVRAVDIESWTLFTPGGLVGRVERAFGPRALTLATAAVLIERLLLVALASVVIGQYAIGVGAIRVAEWRVTDRLTIQELATVGASLVVGLLWIRARLGLDIASHLLARSVWIGIGLLVIALASGTWAMAMTQALPTGLLSWPVSRADASAIDLTLRWLVALAIVLPILGGGEVLTRWAHDFPPPRVPAVRRTARATLAFMFVATALSSLLFVTLVPGPETAMWMNAPLAGIATHLTAPGWVGVLITVFVVVAAVLVLAPAAHAALEDAEQLLRRLSARRELPDLFGRAVDVTAAASVLIIVGSGGEIPWLARAYGAAIAVTLLLKIGALIRLRRMRPEPGPFRVPFNLRLAGRELPLGLAFFAAVVVAGMIGLLASGDIPSIVIVALVSGVTTAFVVAGRRIEAPPSADAEAAELLLNTDVSLGDVDARPGNVLVAVRHVHAVGHLAAALHAAGDRDVIVMTVRLLGIDVDEDGSTEGGSGEGIVTRDERRLFTEVVALTERLGRPVRLLIVPAHNIFDAVVATVLRTRSSDVYVSESSTLSAAEQARLLGDAWERAEKPEALDLRLVVHHGSGREDAYHIGAHPPSLTPGDLELIHRVWLDAVKAIGPHVHHHDVVRAALTKMEHQLTGPERDEALAVIRHVARPADELAAAVRERNYAGLRDLLRNRHADDLATLLSELGLEDQVVVFRLLPRRDAAAVFEYLSHEAQEALLKAMAQEDVAALLNNMAPDDRTMFLEELPATATRQLLTLLSPAERSVALTLLGYPEGSIGRLMTPHYVAVREHWTVREVLDHIRAHGQDSETLNVVYVVDEHETLVDDVRIRELLLTPLDKRVSDLMDRRFVALKASDDQQTAVAVFRRYDRTALPVTDTAGTLIGIVTIDDVLDVAEKTATKDIHRIGGQEALDEPYMEIAFASMIRKRAGWLTALFLGEMLTATAMGAFEAEIEKAVVLAMFVPLIISSGGNSGSQASTLVIRALALGEVGLIDWWRVMRREVLAGIVLGGILGTIGFLRITIWSAFSDMYGQYWLLVALTVAFALVGIVLWGTLVGSLLPFLLRRLGFDPATSSAPFVATLVDVTGLVIYFSVALIILRGTLL